MHLSCTATSWGHGAFLKILTKFMTAFDFGSMLWIRWVEEDPLEILKTVHECIEETVKGLQKMNISKDCIKGSTRFHSLLIVFKISLVLMHNRLCFDFTSSNRNY